MKQTKLLKSILIPTLGISVIGTIATISTSCGSENPNVVHVAGVTLDKTSTTLAVGDTETLIATVLPENATDKSVTWSSNNESVATVVNGTITAVGVGNATITVTTNDGGLTATCVVTVNSVHITSITLNKTSTTLAVGDTETLIATISPENATDKSVTWSSNNESVAIVNENGTITAVGLGTANITVRTNDGGLTATCEVNVCNPYVVVTANADSTLTLNNIGVGENNPDLQYTTDGTNWTTYNTAINISQGQRLYLKGNNPTGWSHTNSSYSSLSITGDVSISGNVMGLLDNGAAPGKEGDITTIPCDYCFYDLFENSTGITSISEDFLPATNLKSNCYNGMFYKCTALPAAPELPATILADSCYSAMLAGCASLITAPKLPAKTLADWCYTSMFSGCTSLTTAPELPATTLAENCFLYMFYQCTSLTTAPTLPATRLFDGCYQYIFFGCKSLNSIKIGYLGYCYKDYFSNWVNGVASSGTFYNNEVSSQTAQDFQLPSGWTTEKFN